MDADMEECKFRKAYHCTSNNSSCTLTATTRMQYLLTVGWSMLL
jgi:hypothetical protein